MPHKHFLRYTYRKKKGPAARLADSRPSAAGPFSLKEPFDKRAPVCYNVPNAGEIVAASQIGQGPDRNLIPAAKGFLGSPKSESKYLQTDSAKIESHKLHWLWKETVSRLRRLDARAREGKFVDEASEFARWVKFSGLLLVFKAFEAPPPLEVSPKEVERLITEILFDCEAHWKNEPRGPWVEKSELESINHKLDLVASQLSKLSPPVTETASAVQILPALRVIQGGAT
jgi:hypothetical protein